MKDLTVKCFNEQGAEAELKKCPEIVQDYVKKLKGSADNWKGICADAVAKLRNRSKNNDVLHRELLIDFYNFTLEYDHKYEGSQPNWILTMINDFIKDNL